MYECVCVYSQGYSALCVCKKISMQWETKKLYTLLNQAIVNLSVTKTPRLISQVNKHL